MRYAVEGEDLCIRIPLDAFVECAEAFEGVKVKVIDKTALAISVGRELCDCEDPYSAEFYLSKPLDDALERVIESADPSITTG